MRGFTTLLVLMAACGPGADLPSVSGWVPAPPPPAAGWVDEPEDAGADDVNRDASPDLPGDADAGPPDADEDLPFDPCRSGPEEPNDSPAAAREVEGPSMLEGRVCENDVDWFLLRVPPGDSVSARVEFSHDEGDLDMRVWRGDVEIAASVSESDVERFDPPVDSGEQWFLLEVYGFDGAEADYTLILDSFGPANFEGLAVGSVAYEDRVFGAEGFTGQVIAKPARAVVVQVLRLSDGAVVGEAVTRDDGAFEIVWPGHTRAEYKARALAAVRVGALTGSVQERSGAHLVYALESENWTGEATPTLDLMAAADESIGGAMNIADQLGVGMRFVSRYTDAIGSMSVRWTRGRAFDCGSCYGGDRISLGGAPDDPDHYDDDIILHELGHWVMHRFSADDSPGGTHRDRQVSPVLAYGEGVAYFLSAMWRDSPTVTDNFADGARHIDLEAVTQNMEDLPALSGTTDGTIYGDLREEIPAAILWDAYDAPSQEEPFDTVEIGADGHAEILFDLFAPRDQPSVGARGIDLVDWLSVASCWRPEIAMGVAELALDRDFPFEPEEHVECGKSGERRRTRVAPVGGGYAVVGLAHLDVVGVDARIDGAWRRNICGALPCALQSVKSVQEIVTVVRHTEGVERASWVSPQRLVQLRGGRPSYGVLAYRTSGMVAR